MSVDLQAMLDLLRRRLLPRDHPDKLTQVALEQELVKLQGDTACAPRAGHWRARIELTLPKERDNA